MITQRSFWKIAPVLLGGAIAAVLSQQARADQIPEVMLKADFQQCQVNAGRNQFLSEEQIDAYCQCNMDGLRTSFDLKSYTELSIALQSGGETPHRDKMVAIVTECVKQTLQ